LSDLYMQYIYSD